MVDKKKDNQKEKSFDKSIFDLLRFAYRDYIVRLILFMVVGFLGRAVILANANFLGRWIDQGQPEPRTFLGQTFLFMVIGFTLTWVFRVGFSQNSARAVSQIYDEVVLRISRAPKAFFDATPSGRIVSRFASDYGNVFRFFGGPLGEFISILFDLVLLSVLTIVANPWFAVLFPFLLFGYFQVYRAHRGPLREARRTQSKLYGPCIGQFAETLVGVSSIRAFNQEQVFQARFQSLDSAVLAQKKTSFRLNLRFSSQMNFLTVLGLCSGGILCLWLSSKNVVTAGDVGVLFGFIVLIGHNIQMFFDWLNHFEEALVGVERLNHYLLTPLEKGAYLPKTATFPTFHPFESDPRISFNTSSRSEVIPQPGTDVSQHQNQTSPKNPAGPAGGVNIENLSFRYSPDGPWILKNITLNIAPGCKVGVIGRTGSGKSTLVQLLLGLYPLEQGRIALDGKELHFDLDVKQWRQRINYVPQEPQLFRESLRANLDPFALKKSADFARVLQAVGLLDKDDAEESLVRLLETQVEEGARNFSVGERQLLCLARALLDPRSLVVLDEATSSVDERTEEKMVHACQDLLAGRTQILVAHRLQSLKHCDLVLWLDRGEVKRFGPREEVLSEFRKAVLREENDRFPQAEK